MVENRGIKGVWVSGGYPGPPRLCWTVCCDGKRILNVLGEISTVSVCVVARLVDGSC